MSEPDDMMSFLVSRAAASSVKTGVCDTIQGALDTFSSCEKSELGARIPTHCLYPSFETVHVHIVRYGDGFKVHDGGGAFRCAWDHGRDAPMITRCLNREAARYHITVRESALIADATSAEWLGSAILSVCNASAAAANSAVAHFAAAAESDLADRINESLVHEFSKKRVSREFLSRGRSGKEYHFDFGVRGEADDDIVLINAVAPHPSSISAKYVAFADGAPEKSIKFAVHDRPLERDDVSLLQQVAEIVPLRALIPGARRALMHAS